MGTIAKSIQTLLSAGDPEQPVTISPEKSRRPASDDSARRELVPPADLSRMELAIALHEALGTEIVGSSTSAFAFLNPETDTLVIVSENDKKFIHVSFGDWISYYAMDIAQDESAAFIVQGDKVICSIHGITESGDSFGEAAMRALLA